jgi:hypothetical protein
MMKASLPADAHLDAVLRGRTVLATAVRERPITPPRATVARVLRLWIALSLAACGGGGGKGGDTYARGTQVQEQCCENLKDGARDECLKKIVRVGDPEVAKTDINQQQYACVTEHFACDPATGHATQASAQAQLDCIQDLEQ